MDGWVQKSNPTIENCFQGIFGRVIGFGFGLGCSSSSSSIPEGIESRGREQQQVSPSRAEHSRGEQSTAEKRRAQQNTAEQRASKCPRPQCINVQTLLCTQLLWHITSHTNAVAHYFSAKAHFYFAQMLWQVSSLRSCYCTFLL